MRLSLALLSGFGVIGALSGTAEDVFPARHNFDRYSAMADHSPFALATAVAVPAATPDFAKDLYVANAAHSAECDMATIASSSDQNFKKYLNTMLAVDGYSIARIEWSEKVGETKVTIGKDGKFATLTFNQALLSSAKPTGSILVDEMRQNIPVVPSPGAGQASRARIRRDIQHDTGLDANPIAGFVPQEPAMRREIQRDTGLDSNPIPGFVPRQDGTARQQQRPMQRPQQPRQSGKDQLPPS